MRSPARVHFVPELGRAIHFSETDLAANASGHLTRGQALRVALSGSGLWLLTGFLAVMAVAVAVVLARAIVGWPSSSVRFSDALLAVIVLSALVVAFAWGARFLWRYAVRSAMDAMGGRVERYEGPVAIIEEETENQRGIGSTLGHFILLGEHKVGIPYAAYRLIPDETRLRIYYAPRSGKIVSLEPAFAFDMAMREPRPRTSFANAIGVFALGFLGFAIGLVLYLFDPSDALVFLLVGGLFAFVGAPLYALGIWWGLSK
jgi:hypothetical protein